MSNRRKLKPSPFVPRQGVVIDARPGADQVTPDMPGQIGAINAWACDACGKLTVVVHCDAGVTPMFLHCRVTEGCEGLGMSLGYPAQHAIPERIRNATTLEWYRPGPKDKIMKDKQLADHIRKGGLALRAKE